MISKFGSKTNGLGDVLLLTSICKYFPNKLTIQLPSNISRFSILFDGLANVEITENINYINEYGSGHYSITKLRYFFGNDADFLDPRPLVLYSDIESEIWAYETLKKYTNPIIFVPNCSKGWHSIRSIPEYKSLKLMEDLIQKKKCTPLLVANSENFPNYLNDYENIFVDIPLKKYICLLRRCGIYFGCDTGDMNLAISTGCYCNVFKPIDGNGYFSYQWNYNHPTIKYEIFDYDIS